MTKNDSVSKWVHVNISELVAATGDLHGVGSESLIKKSLRESQKKKKKRKSDGRDLST